MRRFRVGALAPIGKPAPGLAQMTQFDSLARTASVLGVEFCLRALRKHVEGGFVLVGKVPESWGSVRFEALEDLPRIVHHPRGRHAGLLRRAGEAHDDKYPGGLVDGGLQLGSELLAWGLG